MSFKKARAGVRPLVVEKGRGADVVGHPERKGEIVSFYHLLVNSHIFALIIAEFHRKCKGL